MNIIQTTELTLKKKNCGSKLQLWQPNSKRELVYSSDVRQGHASALENASSGEQLLINSASVLRRLLFDSLKNYPPSSGVN